MSNADPRDFLFASSEARPVVTGWEEATKRALVRTLAGLVAIGTPEESSTLRNLRIEITRRKLVEKSS